MIERCIREVLDLVVSAISADAGRNGTLVGDSVAFRRTLEAEHHSNNIRDTG